MGGFFDLFDDLKGSLTELRGDGDDNNCDGEDVEAQKRHRLLGDSDKVGHAEQVGDDRDGRHGAEAGDNVRSPAERTAFQHDAASAPGGQLIWVDAGPGGLAEQGQVFAEIELRRKFFDAALARLNGL